MNYLFAHIYFVLLIISFLVFYCLIDFLSKKSETINEIKTEYGSIIIWYILYSVFFYIIIMIPNSKFPFSNKIDIDEFKYLFAGIKFFSFFGALSSMINHIKKNHKKETTEIIKDYENRIIQSETKHSKEHRTSYENGYDNGYKKGYDDGYDEGFHKGVDDIPMELP